MNDAKNTTRICEVVNYLDEFRRHVFLEAPELARLLDSLDAGIMPAPLDVMIAISQGVAYFTDGKSSQGESAGPGDIAPGGLCPTC